MGNNLRERVAANTSQNAPGKEVEQKPATLAQQVEQWQQEFALAMPRGMEAQQLVRDALQLMRTTKHLSECTPASVLGGLMTFAQLGLRPGVLGHGWLLPFKKRQIVGKDQRGKDIWGDVYQAQIVIGYKGYVELVHRSGEVESMTGRAVFERDEFSVDYGTTEQITHKPYRGPGGRGPVTDYYAVIKYRSGGFAFWTMTRDEAIEWRNKFAMTVKRDFKTKLPVLDEDGNVQGSGPWFEMDNGPEGACGFDQQAIKTCFLRAQRWAPKGTDLTLARASEVDGAVRLSADPDNPDEMLHAEHPVIDMDEPADSGTRPDNAPPAPPVRDIGKPAAAPAQLHTEFPPVPGNGDDDPATTAQKTAIGRLLALPDAARLAVVARLVGLTRPLESTSKLTKREAGRVIEIVSGWKEAGTFDAQLPAVLAAAEAAGLGGSTAAAAPELPRPGTKAWHDDQHPIRTEDGPVVRVPTVMNGDCSICIDLAEEAGHGGK